MYGGVAGASGRPLPLCRFELDRVQRCQRAKSLPAEPSFLEETGSARISGAFRFGLREQFLAFRMRGLFSPTFPSSHKSARIAWSLAGGMDDDEKTSPRRVG
jgi:hypothetical protein